MELRPVQTALLAGRAASRWAILTSSPASKLSIPLSIYASTLASRSFSSTRPSLQEAEATAPAPSGGMAGYFKERAQHQGRRQSHQQQPELRSEAHLSPQTQETPAATSNSIFAPGPLTSTAGNNASELRQPWASRPSNAQIVPSNARGGARSTSALADLGVGKYADPILADIEKQRAGLFYEKPIDRKYRLRPVIGRTVELSAGPGVNGNTGRNVDLARGLQRLDMQCRVNRVKADSNKQRFHERNGMKKKRLRSERWQRRFMDGFKATCKRVNELAKQGW